jgi:hypothetical protein
VEDDVSELLILDRVFQPTTPKLAKLRKKDRAVELEAEQRIIGEQIVYTILDKKGNEVKLETFATAPAEEEPTKVLAEAKEKILNLEVPPNKALELFRSKIVNRPKDVQRTNRELFEVFEYTLVYLPIYQITYRNVKTDDTKSITVDGVTAKLLSTSIERSAETPRTLCPDCDQLNEENAKFCRECGQPMNEQSSK